MLRSAINDAIVPGKQGDALTEVAGELNFQSSQYAELYDWAHRKDSGCDSRFAATLYLYERMINDPELILADEPTGNLDPETTEEILSLLFEIAKSGRAILMATHDYTYMQKFSSRTIKCQNNKVIDSKNEADIERSTPEYIMPL